MASVRLLPDPRSGGREPLFTELVLGDKSTPYVSRTDKTKIVRVARVDNGIFFYRRGSDDELMKAPKATFHEKYVRMENT